MRTPFLDLTNDPAEQPEEPVRPARLTSGERSERRKRIPAEMTDAELDEDLAYERAAVREINDDLRGDKGRDADPEWLLRALGARRRCSARAIQLGKEVAARCQRTQAEWFVLAAKQMIKERDMKKIWAVAKYMSPGDPAWEGGIVPKFLGGKTN